MFSPRFALLLQQIGNKKMFAENISDSGFLTGECNGQLFLSSLRNITEICSGKGYCDLYKAERLGKWFVLKCLKKEYANNPLYQSLLRKEFEMGYMLSHPNIVQTYGMENIEGCGLCIVLEYVDGKTLRECIDNRQLPFKMCVHIIKELCDALSYIHERQIVHRDLKPENILITYNGHHVKLIDFGCSDADHYALLKAPAGTRKYAAPELLKPDIRIDSRADIYALGVIMKEMRPSDPFFLSVGNRCCRKQPEQRPAYASDVPRLIKRSCRYKRMICWSGIISIVVLSVFIVEGLLFKPSRNLSTDTTPKINSLPVKTTAAPEEIQPSSAVSEEKGAGTDPSLPARSPISTDKPALSSIASIPTVTDFLGPSYAIPQTVYGHDQHGFNLSNTLSMDVSDKMLAFMCKLEDIKSKDSLLILLQTIQADGGLREQIKRELYRKETEYQQKHNIKESRHYRVIDYKLDKTYAQLKGIFRPIVAGKIAEFYSSPRLPLNEQAYQYASASVFKHFRQQIQACDTMQSDISFIRFQAGYWKYKARTESSQWLAEQVFSESALYSQCEEIINSTVDAFADAYDYLLHRKSLEMQERLGQTIAIVTESEEPLPNGGIRRRTLKEDGTWRIEEYDPATLKALEEDYY